METLAAAVFCAAFLAACIWAGSVLSVLGVCIYAYLDRAFSKQLVTERANAFQSGFQRGKDLGERTKKYNESEMPKTAQEQMETKAWAESMIALYPNDPDLKAEVDKIQKERKLLDSVDR